MSERKTRLTLLGIFLTLLADLTAATGWAAPGYGTRACVDEIGHATSCTDNPGTWHECRAAIDGFGRCPDDPVCYDAKGQTRCAGKVVLATARCVDGTATASATPVQACMAHGGIAVQYSGH